ncbi:MAG: hypothetical protein LBL83_06655 [Clostridiales bacterium]|jgi:hypothetical protein|nr:hypothetical protein [Clostridiales bacterium]
MYAQALPPSPAPAYTQAPPPPFAPAPPPAPKKRGFKPLVAIIIAAVALAGVAVGGFALFGGNSYAKAEANFFSSLSKTSPLFSDKGYKATFIADYAPKGELAEYVSEMELNGAFSQLGQNASAELHFNHDGITVELDALFDGRELAFSLPDLSTYWMKLAMLGASDEYDDAMGLGQLDQKKLGKSVENILKTYFELSEGAAEVTKGKELSGGGVTVKCDEYVIDFNQQMVYSLAQAAITEFRANQNLMDFIDAYGESVGYYSYYNGERFIEGNNWGGIDKYIDDIEDDIQDMLDDLDGDDGRRLFRMTAWVKGNKLIGRKIDRVADYDLSLDYRTLSSGDKTYFETNGGYEDGSASLSGAFEKSGGSWSGTPRISLKDYNGDEVFSMRATCKDLKLSDGKLVGSIKLSGDISDYDSYSYNFSLAFDRKDKQQLLTVSGRITDEYSDSYDIGELTLAYGVESIGNLPISMPREDDCIVINRASEANQAIAEAMRKQIQGASGRYENNDGITAFFSLFLNSAGLYY